MVGNLNPSFSRNADKLNLSPPLQSVGDSQWWCCDNGGGGGLWSHGQGRSLFFLVGRAVGGVCRVISIRHSAEMATS